MSCWRRSGLAPPPPELSQEQLVEVSELFWWLRACITMAGAGSQFYTGLTATVTARTLSVVVCGLFPADAGSSGNLTKAGLRTLRHRSFEWPVQPEALPALPKNIAKNFTETFFRVKGRGLVEMEAARMKEKVRFLSSCLSDALRV